MSTLAVSAIGDSRVLDRVTIEGGQLQYETGAARDMFENLTNLGFTPKEAFDMRTGWSNGYVLIKLVE